MNTVDQIANFYTTNQSINLYILLYEHEKTANCLNSYYICMGLFETRYIKGWTTLPNYDVV